MSQEGYVKVKVVIGPIEVLSDLSLVIYSMLCYITI